MKLGSLNKSLNRASYSKFVKIKMNLSHRTVYVKDFFQMYLHVFTYHSAGEETLYSL